MACQVEGPQSLTMESDTRATPALPKPEATPTSLRIVHTCYSYGKMSTFNGVVSEFPRTRIDFFRTNPSEPPPLPCFLSHIHSNHLQGPESLKAPFVYRSPTTRRLLLRVEKCPDRMNFVNGIQEVRKQSYRHLQLILKVLPLQTLTEVELGPKERIRVTLFDANYCAEAVEFFIEGDGKAILYTGDVRAESWWVNSIIRNPILIPYTVGGMRLDCLYLDTTFATKDDIYYQFPSKATGLHELLHKVYRHPPEMMFYFCAWTIGYEDVLGGVVLGPQVEDPCG